MQTFKKSERLCNFNLKSILFEKGNSFFSYPFKIQWLIIQNPIEKYILNNHIQQYTVSDNVTKIIQQQNPSFPHKKIPQNAFFYYPAKCLISVSAKKFKNATDRNYIKRIIKEAYRKNKSSFYSLLNEKEMFCLIGIIYTGKAVPGHEEIEKKIILSLQELEKLILSSLET
ncbi:MAG: ribonuclease P protein component [Bacteroidetes bacterium]|nr:ribonuclease P protein component [Bacteroidota bacterium]